MSYIGSKGKELCSRQILYVSTFTEENNLVCHKEKTMWKQMVWTREKSGVLRWKKDQHKWNNSVAQEESAEVSMVQIVGRENYKTK